MRCETLIRWNLVVLSKTSNSIRCIDFEFSKTHSISTRSTYLAMTTIRSGHTLQTRRLDELINVIGYSGWFCCNQTEWISNVQPISGQQLKARSLLLAHSTRIRSTWKHLSSTLSAGQSRAIKIVFYVSQTGSCQHKRINRIYRSHLYHSHATNYSSIHHAQTLRLEKMLKSKIIAIIITLVIGCWHTSKRIIMLFLCVLLSHPCTLYAAQCLKHTMLRTTHITIRRMEPASW